MFMAACGRVTAISDLAVATSSCSRSRVCCSGTSTDAPEQHFFHYALNTSGGDLDAWMAHLQDHDVAVLGPYGHGGPSFLSIYFDDPDGYRWELTVDYPDFDSAKVAALAHGGKLGNPTAAYDWDS
jgi:catechol 2,3-dioxygenase-like lactoylglutathione lyase family enzyme